MSLRAVGRDGRLVGETLEPGVIMNRNQVLTRTSTAVVGGVVAALAMAPVASARPHAGEVALIAATTATGCPLQRVDDQLVRCDDLTGNGVAAPSFVPVGG
jgi:hypothetical protein